MGTTGLIFGVIVAAWLAYLVPMWVRRDSAKHEDVFELGSRFSNDLRIVRESDTDDARATRVSTPHTRRAALEFMRRAERLAAKRRLNVIVVLVAAVVATVALSFVGVTPWWSVAIPSGLLVAFMAVARVTVAAMHRSFDRRLAAMEQEGQEETVLVGQGVSSERRTRGRGVTDSIELGMPVGVPGSLWDPLPITRPTYVSTPPSGGRTVRTIDLTAPEPVPGDNKPVVADQPEELAVEAAAGPRLRAVGE